MKVTNWFKRKMAALAFATAKVEQNALGQGGQALETSATQEQRHKQGMLSDALQRGELTQEVKDLRWRMYKVLRANDGLSAKVVGHEDDGTPIVKMAKRNVRRELEDIKVDTEDIFKVIMVVDNSEVRLGLLGAMETDTLNDATSETKQDKDGDNQKTIGEIKHDDHTSNITSDRPIIVDRETKPKFEIEKYTKKLVVREISGTERLLEFYISKYPDEFNRKTNLLISEIKKSITKPWAYNMLDILNVGYITNKTMGAKDFEVYEYSITGFHKIIEYNGHYVIKFKAIVTNNGEDMLEQFREGGLDERYKNKERK